MQDVIVAGSAHVPSQPDIPDDCPVQLGDDHIAGLAPRGEKGLAGVLRRGYLQLRRP
jgi:hypothetical protein